MAGLIGREARLLASAVEVAATTEGDRIKTGDDLDVWEHRLEKMVAGDASIGDKDREGSFTCWNSPLPVHMVARPQRTIHLVRAGRQTPTPTSASWIEPSLVGDDEPEFATLPAPGSSWPYGGGWR
jgi:hypothetical protein